MSTSTPSLPAARLRAPRRVLPTLALLLAGAVPALAGNTTNETVQAGDWFDPAVWSLGTTPTGVDHAFVRHSVTVQSAGDDPALITVQLPGLGDEFRIEAGADLTSSWTWVGGAFPATLVHAGGASAHGFLSVGSSTSPGSLSITGGSLNIGTLYLGSPGSGVLGTVNIVGGDADITIGGGIVEASGELVVWPDAPGADGLSPIVSDGLQFQPGSRLVVIPRYPAQVGDSWEVLQGTPSGDFELAVFGPYTVATDTSTPGVLRVVVTESVYPIAGNTCDSALPMNPEGDLVGFSVQDLTTTSFDPTCGLPGTAIDFWHRVDNASEFPRSLSVSIELGLGGLEVYDACGGELLGCAAPDDDLVFELPGSGSRLVRWVSTVSGEFPIQLSLTRLPWVDLGGASTGALGEPRLLASGPLSAGSELVLEIDNTPPNALCLFLLSSSSMPLPWRGGVLHALPFDAGIFLTTDALGGFAAAGPMPPGLPADVSLWWQVIVADPTGIAGTTLTNGMLGITP